MIRDFTVICESHGLMERDVVRLSWVCLTCHRYVTDESIAKSRLNQPIRDKRQLPVKVDFETRTVIVCQRT